jgi:hypothetical protein
VSRKPKGKRRQRIEEIEGIDYVGLLRAAGAAVLLLGISLGFAALVRVAVGAGGEGPAAPVALAPAAVIPEPKEPPRKKADEPKIDKLPPKETPWTARPDPPAQPPRQWNVPPGPGVPVNGIPLFASGGGPFVIDTPEVGVNFNVDLHKKEGPWIPVFDLSAGRGIGWIAKAAPRGRLSLLSPDGRYVIAQGLTSVPNEPLPVAVWKLEGGKPSTQFKMPGGVSWIGFANADDLVVKCFDGTRFRIQVWSVSNGQLLRDFPLSPQTFAPPGGLGTAYLPDRSTGAVSPGGNYVALGGPTGIALFSLADGRHLGTLPLEGKRLDYRGMRFSADGAELTGVFACERGDRSWSVRLRTWQMADGKPSLDVGLTNLNAHGPPLPGPEPGTVFLRWWQHNAAKPILLGQVVDTRTGKSVRDLPYLVVRWLADGRLLVVGPLKDAPARTPPPSSVGGPKPGAAPERDPAVLVEWERRYRNDPTVRALYPVTIDRAKDGEPRQ